MLVQIFCSSYATEGAGTVSELIFSENSRSHDFYVTYEPDGGFGNRLEVLLMSWIFAFHTNRTLVTKPFRADHKANAMLTHEAFLDITGVRVATNASANILGLSEETIPLDPNRCNQNIKDISDSLQTSQAKVLKMPDYWFFWLQAIDSSQIYSTVKLVTDHLVFQQYIFDIAHVLQHEFPTSYAAIHFRIGDRPGFSLANCSLLHTTTFPLLELANMDRYELNQPNSFEHDCDFVCLRHISPAKGARPFAISTEFAVATWKIPGHIRFVYVATDSPEHNRTKKLFQQLRARGLHVFSWSDFPADVIARAWAKNRLDFRVPSQISLVEQLLCEGADMFLPSWPSSWSEWVIARRMAAGKVDAMEQFEELRRLSTIHCDIHAAKIYFEHLTDALLKCAVVVCIVVCGLFHHVRSKRYKASTS